ncbi:MAG: DNA repair protein RecN [Nitrospiraceae bacterium]|nr:DNA repair protein RecN [Nitrospiraceae bacterium]
MLRELRIRDFAIIRELRVSFSEGLTVLTGETGAGKSIIVDALGLALGGRASQEMIRSGSDSATVEVFFDLDSMDGPQGRFALLDELGIWDDVSASGGIILRRVISSTPGRSRAYLNDSMTGVQTLSELGRDLVDIHGQHDHQSLLSPQSQMKILDDSAGLSEERMLVGALYARARQAREKLEAARSSRGQIAQKRDLLAFQCQEIESAGLKAGEDAAIGEEINILSNQTRLRELMETSYSLLYESEGAALENLQKARAALNEAASIDPRAGQPLEFIGQALPLLEESAMLLRSGRDRYEPDPERLADLEERLELLKRLKKKYGGSIEEVALFLERTRRELDQMTLDAENEAALEREVRELDAKLLAAAESLSAKREKFARNAEKAVGLALRDLALEKAQFRIDMSRGEIGPDGFDRMDFLFNANPGDGLKPLGKVASGGELSRLMLAIKSALRSKGVPVLVFDEVDAGIGGKTSWNVAGKLKELARTHQVLCITHQPQIAGAAGTHFTIEKEFSPRGRETSVIIRQLDGGARLEEIARMLSGKLSDVSLKHAKELIERGLSL